MSTLPLNFSKDLVAGNVKNTMKAFGAGRSDTYQVDPRKIKFMEGFNPRTERPEYEAHVEHLTQSIMANGFYADKPIGVFIAMENGEEVVYATDGHTRTKAAIRAIERGWAGETVPVVAKPRGTTMEDLHFATITSADGLALTPYEIGVKCKHLVDCGVDIKTIAKRINRTAPYVEDLLDLVGAPKAIRDMVASGQVAATLAIKELKEHGPKAVLRLKEGLETAKAAGKTKVTNKHVAKAPAASADKPHTLKLNGVIHVTHNVGQTYLKIELNEALEVQLLKGDKVRLVIVQGDEEL